MTEPDAGEEWEFTGYIEGTTIPVHRRKYAASIGPVDFQSLVDEAYWRLGALLANEKAMYNYVADASPHNGRRLRVYAMDIEPPKPDVMIEPPVTLFAQQLARSATAGGGMEDNLLHIETNKEPKRNIVEAIKALAGDEKALVIRRAYPTNGYPKDGRAPYRYHSEDVQGPFVR